MIRRTCILLFPFLVGNLHSQTLTLRGGELCGGVLPIDNSASFRQESGIASQLFTARAEPVAVRKGIDEFRLMLGIRDSNVAAVELASLSFGLLFDVFCQGQRAETLHLYDDGSHGDEVAGDRIFTVGELSLQALYTVVEPIFVLDIRFSEIGLTFANGARQTFIEDLGLTIHYYDPAIVAVPRSTRLAEDVRATDYVVNVAAAPEGSFPQQSVRPRDIAKRYYEIFQDDRDFLILAHTFSTASSAGAMYNPVSNAVQGIGWKVFDQSAEYGSAGRLQGTIHLFSGIAFPQVLTHEMLHRWVASLSLDPALDLGSASGHWQVIQRNSTGFGEGGPYNGVFSELVQLPDNTFKAIAENVAAQNNDLELYFMGLLPLSEITAPIIALVNPQMQDWQNYIYAADGIHAVQLDEIVAALGPRIPEVQASQKNFAAAMIVVHDRLLSDTELAYYDFLAREYEKAATENLQGYSEGQTFEAATGGRATMNTRLSAPQTGVQTQRDTPEEFRLAQNYPNPFNPATTIAYELVRPALVKLAIYDVQGRLVRVLVNEWQNSGAYSVVWQAGEVEGNVKSASGWYFYELTVDGNVIRKKMALVR